MNIKKVLTMAIFCGVILALSGMTFAKGWPVLRSNGEETQARVIAGGPRLAPHIHINGPRRVVNGADERGWITSDPVWLLAKLTETNQGIEEDGQIIVRF